MRKNWRKHSNLSNAAANRIEEISNQTVNSIQKTATALGNDAFKITKDIADSLHRMMETNNENLQKSATNLSKDLKIKIEESVEKFGDALLLVSNKFVEDYTPLTKKLAALVHLAENIGGKSH